jgi:phage terminase large subunit-like protein
MMLPTRYTKPLNPGPDGLPIHSDGYRLIEFVEKFWILPDGSLLNLDPWQRDLLIRVLETNEAGDLRYRQCLISIPRQQGKSLLGAILQMYGLLQQTRGASVIGLATNVKQASIVYDRCYHVVNSNPILTKKLKATGTRGIRHRDGSGSLYILPAKPESAQGEPVTFALLDELHILNPAIYEAIVHGQRSKKNSLLVGITTAGDDTSTLLLDLYKRAELAMRDPESTFGAFIWEAPTGCAVNDRDAIIQANPAIECGRIDIETVLADITGKPEHDVRRYLLNQFIANEDVWLDPHLWDLCAGQGITDRSEGIHLGIDTGPAETFTTISAARRTEDGKIETEIVAQMEGFDIAREREICDELAKEFKVLSWNLDPYKLKDLATHLENKGRNVNRMDKAANHRAAATAYALISNHRIRHNQDPVLARQVVQGVRKNTPDGAWRIVPAKKGIPLDGLHSTIFACYGAETYIKSVPGLFVGAPKKSN